MSKLIAITAVMAAIGALALGCGSSDEETAAAAPLSKAEFVKQANAICAKTAKENKAALASIKVNPAVGVDEEAKVTKALKEFIGPSMLREAEELEALPAPAKDKAAVAKMIGNLSDSGEIVTEEGWPGVGGSGFSQFQREATEYGLKSCLGLIYF